MSIAEFFGVPAAYFLSGLPGQLLVPPGPPPAAALSRQPELASMVNALALLNKPRRQLVTQLVAELAGVNDNPGAADSDAGDLDAR